MSFPTEFGIGSTSTKDTFLVGLVNAAPYIASALLCVLFFAEGSTLSFMTHCIRFSGCWLSDPLNHFFGRRGCIFFSALFCMISPIGGAFSQNWQQLFITRLLLGIGMGSKASTVPIFAAENSPALIRGTLVMSRRCLYFFQDMTVELTSCNLAWQMWTAFGIFLYV